MKKKRRREKKDGKGRRGHGKVEKDDARIKRRIGRGEIIIQEEILKEPLRQNRESDITVLSQDRTKIKKRKMKNEDRKDDEEGIRKRKWKERSCERK